jgi:hypothetical protein
MKNLIESVGNGKYSRGEIVSMEERILEEIGYETNWLTVFDFSEYLLYFVRFKDL